ncbi:BBP7 family outer membrane beta-barrel protein [Neorhodopirellula lusitana]|uniref:BBP7 family outer membrane beta-barrel protein n=1 Tax=Neorhodopirellula lusitana TaxID=445327 RepID=UPI00384E69D2
MTPIQRILAITAIAALMSGEITVAQTFSSSGSQPGQSSGRRIPVRSYQSGPNRVLAEAPGEQPGEVTSIEIRNEAGELVDSELDEDEYFLGAAPMPIKIGLPMPGSTQAKTASSPTVQFDDERYLGSPEMVPSGAGAPIGMDSTEYEYEQEYYEDGYQGTSPSYGSDCESCDDGSCDGCASRPARHLSQIDARAERIARVLANPLVGFWARAEYMHWKIDGQQVPALVTTSPTGTDRDDAGILGVGNTSILYGNDELGDDDRPGGRFEIGRYFLGESGLGISASFLFADDEDQRFSADSVSYGILGRPFVDVSPTGVGNNSELIAFPNEFTGNVDVTSSTKFSAGDVLLRGILICEPDRQLEGFVGYTYYQLDDDIAIHDFKRVIGGSSGLAVGTTLDETDRFQVDNDFHGAAIGMRSQTCFGGWSLASTLKLGLGVTSSNLNISGATTATVPVAGGTDTSTRNSGLLVQDTNSGSSDFDEFAIAPELGVSLSRRMNRDWSLSAGYQLVYISRVMRAGEQIDPLLNLSQLDAGGLVGTARPQRDDFFTDLTAQAITFGLLREF